MSFRPLRRWLFGAAPFLLATGCGGDDEAPRAGAGGTAAARAGGMAVARAGEVDPWRVTTNGVGPVRIGARYAQVRASLNGDPANSADRAVDRSCGYARTPSMPPGVSVMVVADTIMRIDVDTAGVTTAEGAQVGDTEARVRELYQGRVEVSPHKYAKGNYLTVTPLSPADSGSRIIFETDGERVTRYRAGRRPMVEWVERCG